MGAVESNMVGLNLLNLLFPRFVARFGWMIFFYFKNFVVQDLNARSCEEEDEESEQGMNEWERANEWMRMELSNCIEIKLDLIERNSDIATSKALGH